jgi:hypothetical protein
MNPEQLKIYKRDKSRQFNANLKALRLEKKYSNPGTASPAKPAEPTESGLMLEDIFFKLEELESKLTDLLDVKFDELESKLTDLLDVKLDELESKLTDLLEDTDEDTFDQLETKPRPPFQLQQNAFA